MHAKLQHAAAGLLILGAAAWLYRRLQFWPDTPDGLFHLHRVRALTEAWQQGVFYPRWFPDFAFGYGHPIFNFYAPGYYPFAALPHGLGLDILTANRVALGILFALSGLAVYALLQRWTSFWPALAGTALFLFFPYRLYDLFTRGALPEFAAFLWPPLILYGYHASDACMRRAQPGLRAALAAQAPWLIFTALAWAGLILTHNLTALMAGIVWLVVALIIVLWTSRNKTSHLQPWPAVLFTLSVPLMLGGLLSGFYIAPVVLEAGWVGIGSGPGAPGYADHAVDWTGNWAALWQFEPAYIYPPAAASTVALPVYVGAIALASGLLALTPWARPRRLLLATTLLITVLALWLSTASSLWLWDLTAPILGKLQFPWRWQTVIALGAALLLSLTLQVLLWRASATQRRILAPLAGGLLALYFAVYATLGLQQVPPLSDTRPEITAAQMWAFDFEHGQIGATWTGEFLPTWVTAPRWTIGRAPETTVPPDPSTEQQLPSGQPITGQPGREQPIIARPIRLGYQTAVYALDAPTPLTFTLPHFYYPAWRATLNGTPLPLYASTELGWLAADIPAGEQMLAVHWSATLAVWVGRILTAAGWLGVAVLLWRAHSPGWRTIRTRSLVAWIIVAIVALAGMTNLPAGHSSNLRIPAPLDGDFGPLHLSAAEIPTALQASAGDPAEIVLHWTVQHTVSEAVQTNTGQTSATPNSGEPLHAFVHLVDASGAVVAQYDTVIGGPYLPPERHRPGLPVTSHHPLALPPELPPGTYAALAGVYVAGHADQPLTARGTSESRLPIGEIMIGEIASDETMPRRITSESDTLQP